MVGYGTSLMKARRKGWEFAYLDYGALKLLLDDLNKFIHRFCNSIKELENGELSSLVENGVNDDLCSINLKESIEAQLKQKAEAFLHLVRKEVEKVSLYAISRQGELADAIGALKFNCDDETSDPKYNLSLRHHYDTEILTAVINDDDIDGDSDSAEKQISSAAENTLVDDLSALLPNISETLVLDSKSDHKSLGIEPRPMFSGSGIFRRQRKSNASDAVEIENDDEIKANPSSRSDSEKRYSPMDNQKYKDANCPLQEEREINDFTIIAVEVLHLMRYTCINAMAVRKIIKKYEKAIQKCTVEGCNMEDIAHGNEVGKEETNPQFISPLLQIQNCHDKHVEQLQHLATSKSMTALTASIVLASSNFTAKLLEGSDASLDISEPALRFKCAIDCIDILREYAEVVNQSFPAFLSRQAMIVTGQQLGDLGGMKVRALEVILKFDPDTILRMDKMLLRDWQEECWSYLHGIGKRLRTTSFDSQEEKDLSLEKYALSWGGANRSSLYINLVSIFLYTVNYYIVSPTANRYAILLGSKGAYGSTLIGAASLAAFFGSFLYSWWYTRFSFKSALAFSSFVSVIGNILYAIAISFHSMKVAFVGRLLVGLGSAEVINRQIISSCVHYNFMTRASASFVVASAFGMSVGPLLAAVLDDRAGRDIEIDYNLPKWIPYLRGAGIIFDNVTSPAFLMALLWLIEFLAVMLAFKEPIRINSFKKDEKSVRNNWLAELREVRTLIFKNAALPVTLAIYCYIELLDEVLISSCAMVCKRYFAWNGSVTGYILAALGALVLPADFIVDRASRYFEERVIMRSSLLYICIGVTIILNYQGLGIDIGLATTDGEHLLHQINEVPKEALLELQMDLLQPNTNSSELLPLTKPYHNKSRVESYDANSKLFRNPSYQDWHPGILVQNSTHSKVSGIAYEGDDVNQTETLQIANNESDVQVDTVKDKEEVYPTKRIPYDWDYGAIIYLFALSTIFMATVVLEGVDTSLLSISSPSKLNSTFLSVGLITTLAGTAGRVMADFLITLSAFVDRLPFTDFVNALFSPLIPITLFGMFLVKQYYSALIYK